MSKKDSNTSSSTTTITTTKLPNVDSSKIIPSKPQMVREGSDVDSNHPDKKSR